MTKDNHLLGKFELGGIPPAPRGVPQIEVTFELSVSGILNVAAEDKGTGSKDQITITNDKGRLSQEEIDKMVKEAEDAAEEDKIAKQRVEARNQLENYAYQIRNTMNDNEKVGDKISEDDRETLEKGIKVALEFLEQNPMSEKDEYDEQYKILEKIVQPIFSKLYGQGGGPSPGGDDSGDMPDHDEL